MPCYDLFAATVAPCALVTFASITFPCKRSMPAVKEKLLVNGASQTAPSRSTFTAEEAACLQAWLPQYLTTKREPGKKLVGFWEPMLADWWSSFPLPPLTAEEIASGVDQGDRAGERAGNMQKVSEIVLHLAKVIAHHYHRKCEIGSVITAVMLHQVQANAPYWI